MLVAAVYAAIYAASSGTGRKGNCRELRRVFESELDLQEAWVCCGAENDVVAFPQTYHDREPCTTRDVLLPGWRPSRRWAPYRGTLWRSRSCGLSHARRRPPGLAVLDSDLHSGG